jgi:hypothetical protein
MTCAIVFSNVKCPISLLQFFFLISPTMFPYRSSSSRTHLSRDPKGRAMHLSSSMIELLVRLLMNRFAYYVPNTMASIMIIRRFIIAQTVLRTLLVLSGISVCTSSLTHGRLNIKCFYARAGRGDVGMSLKRIGSTVHS